MEEHTLQEQSVMSPNAEQRGEKLIHLSVSTAINLHWNWVVKHVWRFPERWSLRLLIVYFSHQHDRRFLRQILLTDTMGDWVCLRACISVRVSKVGLGDNSILLFIDFQQNHIMTVSSYDGIILQISVVQTNDEQTVLTNLTNLDTDVFASYMKSLVSCIA